VYDPSKLATRDPVLTAFSVGYADQDLFGLEIFPAVGVNSMHGRYRVFDRSDWLIFPAIREPGTVANEIMGGKWSEDTFNIREYALQAPVLDEEREEIAQNFEEPGLDVSPERDAVSLVGRSLNLQHEKKVADVTRDVTQYAAGNTVTLTGTSRWNDYTTLVGGATQPWQTVSNPINNIRAGLDKVYRLTGRQVNKMVFSEDAFRQLAEHPRIVNRFQNFDLIRPDAVRRLLDYEGEIVIANSKYNSADNIDAAEVITDLWGQDVWMGIVDEGAGVRGKTFGKTFQRPYGGVAKPTDRWREEDRKADLFRTQWRWDTKIISNVAGYLIKTAVDVPA